MTDTFQELCELGRQAAQHIDTGRYFIGDLALKLPKGYGRGVVEDFAKQIGVPKARVAEYRRVSRFWSQSEREQLFDTYSGMVSYTHLRDAMRLKDKAAALDFIRECGSNGYTVELAQIKLTERLGKPVPPPKILDGLAYIVDIRGQYVTLKVDVTLDMAMWEAKTKRLPVDVVVRPSEEHPDFGAMTNADRLGSGSIRRIPVGENDYEKVVGL